MARVASESGCKEMLIGIESGSDTILENINKGVTVRENEEAIKTLYEAGIRVKAAMICMLSGENWETVLETWRWCEEVESYVSEWDWTYFVPYPGSDIWEHPEKYDVFFDKETCYTAYKGMHTKGWDPPKVWTSALSNQEGAMLRDIFEARFKYKLRVNLKEVLNDKEKLSILWKRVQNSLK